MQIEPYLERLLNIHEYFAQGMTPVDVLNMADLKAVYLMQPVFRKLGCKRRNMDPGDILTLYYALNLPIKQDLANLLAARSLIYAKLIETQEILPDHSNMTPHTLDEAYVNRLIDRLKFEDCKTIYSEIRFKNPHESLGLAQSYVRSKYEISLSRGSYGGDLLSVSE